MKNKRKLKLLIKSWKTAVMVYDLFDYGKQITPRPNQVYKYYLNHKL